MTTRKNTQISTTQLHHMAGDPDITKYWLTQHLLKPVLWQGKDDGETCEITRQISQQRPRTAPSVGASAVAMSLPGTSVCPSIQQENKAPLCPLRPDSGVIRDVNAWLDASKPASPLMGGLSYWREACTTNPPPAGIGVQYAIPIVRETENDPSLASHSGQLKSFCRRAKRIQVPMPSLRRTRSRQATARKKANRRSVSTPLLAIPYEETQEGAPPTFLTRFRSVPQRPATATTSGQPSQVRGWLEGGSSEFVDIPLCRESPASMRVVEQECSNERHANAVFSQNTRIRGIMKPKLATAHIPRDNSMGSLSDAPTYFSGLSPPSYRSRAASILTTSSFGCIDGMNPEQRQLSQQRAAQRNRGVKGKLRRLAQRAHLTK